MKLRALALALLLATPAFADPLARAREMARGDAWLERLLTAEARTPARADVLAVDFAEFAGDPIALRAGSLGNVVTRLRPSSADPRAPLHWQGSVGSYAHAEGVTGFWIHAGDVLEQLLLVERPGTSTLDWSLELRDDIRVEAEDGGGFLLVRANGDALLRLPPAWALDGTGRRIPIAAALHREGSTLHIRFDLGALTSFPALVDPALESVLWYKPTLTGTLPSKRSEHAMAYDPVQHEVVLFGGYQFTYLADTWTYDGTSWTKVTTTNAPSGRVGAAMAFVPNPAGMLLFGGQDAAALAGDTWRFDGANWSQLAGAGPAPRIGAQACFAPVIGNETDRVVLYGGDGTPTLPYTDTWQFSNGWTQSTTLLSPEPVTGNAITYDTHHQAVLTVGGGIYPVFQSDSFWSYDGTTWANLPSPEAIKRRQAGFAFDSDRQTAVLFGGEDFNEVLSSTWEWDAKTGTWTERVVVTKPPGRTDMPLVYDANRKRVVLFGGYASNTGLALNDTWEYHVVNGTCTTTDECDGATCVDGACCTTDSCATCSACSSTTGACAPVLNADDPDSCTGANTCDSTGSCKLKAGETCTSADECASLFCADGVCCNSPCQGACEACDLAASAGTCTLVTGDARHGTCPGAAPCGATCTGNSPTCAFAPDGTPCGSSCSTASIEPKSCDGSGVCAADPTELCANHFACLDGQSCRASCTSDEHCQDGYVCREGACVVPGKTCVDTLTSVDEKGNTRDCAPYTCASGECVKSCLSAAQCASGFVCNDKGSCVQPGTDESSDDGGCGCRAVGHTAPSSGWLTLAVLALVRRRRRLT